MAPLCPWPSQATGGRKPAARSCAGRPRVAPKVNAASRVERWKHARAAASRLVPPTPRPQREAGGQARQDDPPHPQPGPAASGPPAGEPELRPRSPPPSSPQGRSTQIARDGARRRHRRTPGRPTHVAGRIWAEPGPGARPNRTQPWFKGHRGLSAKGEPGLL